MNELISVIMPAYNCEKYIAESIKSVILQTFKTWELIIINDCSTDNTQSVINDFAGTDSRIRVYENDENSGVSKTRNKGISAANGSWLAFLDSDDIWHEEKLEKQMLSAKKNNSGFIFTGASYIDENGSMYKGVFNVPESVSYKVLLKQNVISCSSVLIKKAFFDDIKMENDSIHEDFCVWLKILRGGNTAHGINEPLLIYRISRKSKSGNKIKSLKMAYKTYRYIGINPLTAWYYLGFYIVRNLRKYRKIFN
jgi:teichuronic acid biosynthesis glycosyltransferase TuaG